MSFYFVFGVFYFINKPKFNLTMLYFILFQFIYASTTSRWLMIVLVLRDHCFSISWSSFFNKVLQGVIVCVSPLLIIKILTCTEALVILLFDKLLHYFIPFMHYTFISHSLMHNFIHQLKTLQTFTCQIY